MVGSWITKARSLIATHNDKGRKPIQIQADVLRDWKPSGPLGAWGGFARPDDGAEPQRREVSPDEAWRDADLKRAFAIAREAGLSVYRIEIAPDGTITIIVGSPLPREDGEDL